MLVSYLVYSSTVKIGGCIASSRQMTFTRLHGDISRDTKHFIVTAVRTSSSAYENQFEVLSTLLVSKRRCHVVLLLSVSKCWHVTDYEQVLTCPYVCMCVWGLPKRSATSTKLSPCSVVHPAAAGRLSTFCDEGTPSKDRGNVGSWTVCTDSDNYNLYTHGTIISTCNNQCIFLGCCAVQSDKYTPTTSSFDISQTWFSRSSGPFLSCT
jgi:hypothetical protein